MHYSFHFLHRIWWLLNISGLASLLILTQKSLSCWNFLNLKRVRYVREGSKRKKILINLLFLFLLIFSEYNTTNPNMLVILSLCFVVCRTEVFNPHASLPTSIRKLGFFGTSFWIRIVIFQCHDTSVSKEFCWALLNNPRNNSSRMTPLSVEPLGKFFFPRKQWWGYWIQGEIHSMNKQMCLNQEPTHRPSSKTSQ